MSTTVAPEAGLAKPAAEEKKGKGPVETFRDLLWQYRANFAAVLPKHLQIDRLLQVALAAVSRNQRLLDCTPYSVLRALMIAAQLGIDPSGVLGSGYLVPFWNNKVKKYEATFIIGYRGLMDLARRSGEIVGIEAHVVHEKDVFEYAYGINPKLYHVPALDERGNPICAYTIVRLRDGPPLLEIMSAAEIEKIRKFSKAANEGPWVDWPEEMWRKTVTRRGLKYAPLTPEAAQAIEAEGRLEAGEEIGELVTLPPEENGGAAATTTTKAEQVAQTLKERIDEAKVAAAATAPAGAGGAADRPPDGPTGPDAGPTPSGPVPAPPSPADPASAPPPGSSAPQGEPEAGSGAGRPKSIADADAEPPPGVLAPQESRPRRGRS